MLQKIINAYNGFIGGLDKLRREAPLLYSALKTGMAAFGAVMLPVLAAFMTDLYLWIDTGQNFPATDTLLRAAAAGALGFLAAVINFMWNLRERASQPAYPKPLEDI